MMQNQTKSNQTLSRIYQHYADFLQISARSNSLVYLYFKKYLLYSIAAVAVPQPTVFLNHVEGE